MRDSVGQILVKLGNIKNTWGKTGYVSNSLQKNNGLNDIKINS